MITSTQILTIFLFVGFLILVIFAFFPNSFLRFIDKLTSRDIATDYKGISSIGEDQNFDDDIVQMRTPVGLIQTRR